ncbi:hypothetical protein PILCRDRAFT_8647 [Piloderma croceum F 1598]|uniref:Protein kinase domain-containing protein n=1 Tax=Piloderma croceum (strain F 1598) TaxID=765440 RepID=A0A0C3FR69_PILCF|nr:hypothetical protein PILCRDRAFT_8647 [Piloderma croceum F 1598]
MVVLHVLNGLEILHRLGFIHTDVKSKDVLLIPGIEDPVTPTVEGEIELWDDAYIDAKLHMFSLNDVGHEIRADQEKDYELGTPYALHTPEIILRAGYDCKINIWAAFELLTGRWAFHPKGSNGRLVLLCLFKCSELHDNFFNKDGKIKRINVIQELSIKDALTNYNALAADNIAPAAAFIAACLNLDPSERPSLVISCITLG